jgi:hypothetical protein
MRPRPPIAQRLVKIPQGLLLHRRRPRPQPRPRPGLSQLAVTLGATRRRPATRPPTIRLLQRQVPHEPRIRAMPLAARPLGAVGVEAVAESHRPRSYKWPVTATGGYRRAEPWLQPSPVHLVFATPAGRAALGTPPSPRRRHRQSLLRLRRHPRGIQRGIRPCPPADRVPTHRDHPPVNFLKGVSSRRLRQRFGKRTHRDRLWSPSRLAASARGAPRSIIRQYVEAQRQTSSTTLANSALKNRACASKALCQAPPLRR